MLNKIILIDAYAFIFRAYHSLPQLTNPQGLPVGAVYGFINMLIRILIEHKAKYCAVVYDSGKKTFRNDIYKEYKAHRPPVPDDLIVQFPLAREAVSFLGMNAIELAGYEADDLIATIANKANEEGLKVEIVSSDKDLMQLIDDNIYMFDAIKNKYIYCEDVENKFGIKPNQVADYLALVGDRADNVPGVPGIGPKGAVELIGQFGSLKEIIANANQIARERKRKIIEQYESTALLSQKLTILDNEVPIEYKITDFVFTSPDKEELGKFLYQNGFRSLVTRLEKFYNFDIPCPNNNIVKKQELISVEQIRAILQKSKDVGILAIDCIDKDWPNIGIAIEIGEGCVIQNSEEFLKISDELNAIIKDPSVLKICCNSRAIRNCLKKFNIITINSLDDIQIMHHTLGSGQISYELSRIHAKYFEDILEIENPCPALNAESILRVHPKLINSLLQERLQNNYFSIDKPLADLLFKIEDYGVKISTQSLQDLSSDFQKEIDNIAREIYCITNQEFNIASPKQLGEVLFEKMAIPGGKKSKLSGAYNTNIDVLEGLSAHGYEVADKVIKWRHFAKLKSTYTDALVNQIDCMTQKVHTKYSAIATSTGRINSSDPNLQNIPIKTKDGKKIRKAFGVIPGYKLISFDYSQIELRLLAYIANIDSLKQAFLQGKDVHSITASHLFAVEVDKIDPILRRQAKAINFGIIYGMSAFGLAKQIGVDFQTANLYIEHYLTQYSGIREYIQSVKESARQNGYVTTLFNRKCMIKEIHSNNIHKKQFAERLAVNAVIQGSAADIIKKAMVMVNQMYDYANLDAKIILTIHDELLVEVKNSDVENVLQITKDIMENKIVDFHIPVICSIGENWGSMEEFKL